MKPSYSPLFCHCRSRQNGFTLHEAAIALGIAASLTVLASAALPLLHDQQLTAEANALMGNLALARSEAIKRRQQMTMCQSRDLQRCARAPEWHEGWIVFVDADEDEQVDDTEAIVHTQSGMGSGYSVRFGSNKTYVYYKPSGTAWPNATFTLCSPNGSARAKSVILTLTGRPRVSTRTSDGKALSCPALP